MFSAGADCLSFSEGHETEDLQQSVCQRLQRTWEECLSLVGLLTPLTTSRLIAVVLAQKNLMWGRALLNGGSTSGPPS